MPRETDFGFDWFFALTDDLQRPDQGDPRFRAVQLPHDWSIDYPFDENAATRGSGGYARAGIGWYYKEFTVTSQAGLSHQLLFDGVYMNCCVFLNGRQIGGHIYGYTPFVLPLEGLRDGRNTLWVCVDNSRQPNSRWYSGSGITRGVTLLTLPNVHVAPFGVCIRTESLGAEGAQLSVTAELSQACSGEAEILITDAQGNTVLQAREVLQGSLIQAQFYLKDVLRWDIDTPHLYTLRLQLPSGDCVAQSFGIRETRFDAEQGFFLNGRPIKLRGVCLHHDGGLCGAAVPPEIWGRRLRLLKEMGCNAIRCSHNPPDTALLDLCDSMGFLVMDEAFDEWEFTKRKGTGANTHESRGYSEWFAAEHAADLRAMLRRDRNHPSVIIWSIGNEVPEQVLPGGDAIAARLAAVCHEMDPTRPVTQANDMIRAQPNGTADRFLRQLDLVGLNYVDRWGLRTETFYDGDKRDFPQRLYIGTEHGAIGGVRGDYALSVEQENWGSRPYYSAMLKAEQLLRYNETRAFVLGDFMWTGIDHLGENNWPRRSATTGVLDLCAFPKDGYYFYQSQWRRQPMLHVFPHWNLPVPRGTVVPVLAYTNCFQAELFVNGTSYGKKAYEFPAQGMTEQYNHFAHAIAPITTNDLHLSWDVPYEPGVLELVAYDVHGAAVLRKRVETTGKATTLMLQADQATLPANGRAVSQVTIALRDAAGRLVPDDDRALTIRVSGAGRLLGADNGDPENHALFAGGCLTTFHGLALCAVQAGREGGKLQLCITADGIAPQEITITVT